MIFGNHAGLPEEGYWAPEHSKMRLYCHSDRSWKALWEEVFGEGNIEVQAVLNDYGEKPDFFDSFPGNTVALYELEWSVTRN